MIQQPSIPRGTRDFTPAEMARRNFIFDSIRKVFNSYGYLPVETPAMENLSTLLGKYGEEGDRLLFRVLNSGDFLSDVGNDVLAGKSSLQLSSLISEKGLRYDLTVPFARFVVMHRNEITFPLKRYQIQTVWRADRPQKGRYREFYQCDADVIGSDSLLNELELVQIVHSVFKELNVNFIIKLNNRKILAGIAELIGEKDRITDITIAIDKLDKTNLEQVNAELLQKGLKPESVDKLQPVLCLKGNNNQKLEVLNDLMKNSEEGQTGTRETAEILNLSAVLGLDQFIELDLTLARGLNYYTGAIFEVKSKDIEIGSICGGGRYDNLTGIFGMPGISGTGISFGADRIYDVMDKLGLFPENTEFSTSIMFTNFGEKEARFCLTLIQKIRQAGISAELYPDPVKIKKQMSYADARKIRYVVLAGEEEISQNIFSVKNMISGEQLKLSIDQIIDLVNQKQ